MVEVGKGEGGGGRAEERAEKGSRPQWFIR